MSKVQFLQEAIDDIESARKWYRERSARATDRFETALKVAIKRIQENPDGYAKYDEVLRCYDLQKYPYGIIYYHAHKTIVIFAVAHASRDWSFLQDRDY